MPVLLALSILAFVALLWATISIAGTVRRAHRRRRRREAEVTSAHAKAAALAAVETQPLFYADPAAEAAHTRSPREAVPPADLIGQTERLPTHQDAPGASAPEEVLVTAAQVQLPVRPAGPSAAQRDPVERIARLAAVAVAAAVEALPPPRPPEPPPPRLRVFPTRLGKHPVATAGPEAASPAWNPFREEYADLTDPAPRRRTLEARARNKNRSK